MDFSERIYDTLQLILTQLGTLTTVTSSTAWNVTSIQTGTYSAAIGDAVQVNTQSAVVTVNLPQITAANKGRKIFVTATPVTNTHGFDLIPFGAQTVGGQSASAFPGVSAPGFSTVLVSDGVSNWLFESQL